MLPIPPIPAILSERFDWTVPAPEWEEWAKATLVEPSSPLANPLHAHLLSASIGFLLTNAKKVKGKKRWSGSGGAWKAGGDGWAKAQASQRMVEWFGHEPDFLITLDVTARDFESVRGICHLVDHELRHCGIEQDEHGSPRYDLSGRPIWTTNPHYAELCEGDLGRWGLLAVSGGDVIARELAGPPEITDEMLRFDG